MSEATAAVAQEVEHVEGPREFGPDGNTPAPSPSRLGRAVGACCTAVTLGLLGAVAVGLVAGYQPLLQRAGTMTSRPVRVEIEWPPLAGLVSSAPEKPGGPDRTWANEEIRAKVRQAALDHLTSEPFDSAGLARARDALGATGWFKDDLRVVRDPRGVVRVTGSWRTPVGAVRYAGEDHLVTRDGERLPLAYKPGAAGMRVVLGVTSALPPPGTPWPGGRVQEGLKLLSFLRGTPGYGQVAGVDVSEFGAGRRLVVVTDTGGRIVWGGPPDERQPGQISAAQKVRALAQLLNTYGRIDAGRAEVDIRTWPVPVYVDTESADARALLNRTPASRVEGRGEGARAGIDR